ncbi:hypothetical protein QZH41_008343 [Actinostola sp. cb2023]|nr:hypothetical protein QZH41_008343 [Actinostola sp. cb2023]
MSTEFTEEEWQKTVNFLNEFTSEHPTPTDESQPLPLRVVPSSVGHEELAGNLIDWTLECLRKCNCPDVLATIITHHATQDIIDGDLCCYKHEDSQELDMTKVARVAFNNIQNVCIEWNQETPKLYKSKSLFGLNKGFPDFAFFAVYDGHGGLDAAVYSSIHLHYFLAKNKNLSTDPGLALHETFLMTDDSFGEKAKAEGLRSGCTAVTVLISDDKMYIAWLGDSQVVLCKAGESVLLMEPHKPDNQDEKERIESLGGCVVYFGAWRVNGNLSVSRAIGDVEHKPYISGEPFVAEYSFEGDEEFLILACDGLWDTIGRDHAVELVKNHIAQGNTRDSAAKLLVVAAKDAGSSDNISVIVVYLDAHMTSNSADNGSISLTNQQEVNSSQNGTIKCNYSTNTNSLPSNGNENCHADGTRVHIVEKDAESHGSIVAKVKISAETTRTASTKNVTCRVTSEKHDSCNNGGQSTEESPGRTSKSADNSPKQMRKGKADKTKSPTQSKKDSKSKSKSPHQLNVDQHVSSRRRSAPGAFTS